MSDRVQDVLAVGRALPAADFVQALQGVIEHTESLIKDLDVLCSLLPRTVKMPVRNRLVSLFRICQFDLGITSETLAYQLANNYPDDARAVSALLKARLEQLRFALHAAQQIQ